MSNGDWFDNEMAATREDLKKLKGNVDTIKMMRTPVISSIIDKTPSIPSDSVLSQVIAAIDRGETEYQGVTSEDFETVLKARMVVYSIGPNHTAVIPKYAAGKAIAVDFLRFFASDTAQEIYIRSTKGATLPYRYNVKEKNPELYDLASDFQKDIIDYFNNPLGEVTILPSPNSFPMVLFGDLTSFASLGSSTLGYQFTSGASKGDYATLAEKIFYTDYKYWTEANRWNDHLSKVGM
jgi:hypothetical protein